MLKILKYSFFDLSRSYWNIIYFLFFLVTTIGLVQLSGDSSRTLVSMMNIVIVLVPLIATLLGVMYYYNSRDFIELLLAQPLKRSNVFLGQYFGLTLSLCLSFTVGILVGLLITGTQITTGFIMLLVSGVFLTAIFAGISFFVSINFDNRIKGFGLAILIWLFFSVIYDGMFLLSLVIFKDYPLETYSLSATLFNPIDLSRILVILDLDISALMGYSGAVFAKFYGAKTGILVSLLTLLVWSVGPVVLFVRSANRKDF